MNRELWIENQNEPRHNRFYVVTRSLSLYKIGWQRSSLEPRNPVLRGIIIVSGEATKIITRILKQLNSKREQWRSCQYLRNITKVSWISEEAQFPSLAGIKGCNKKGAKHLGLFQWLSNFFKPGKIRISRKRRMNFTWPHYVKNNILFHSWSLLIILNTF